MKEMENKKISERPFAYSGRGGARPGAGRPKGSKSATVERQPRMARTTAEEWVLVKAFIKVLKKDPERAKRMLQTE